MADQTKTASSQKLTRTDLLSMAVGQIIGVGIMTMTGIAIGFTGRSVVFAYLLGGLFTLITAVPQIFIGGTANFLGGQYSQVALLSGRKPAGIFTYVNLCMIIATAMYGISFADYFLSMFPNANGKIAGFIAISLIYLLHLVGVKSAARLQNLLSLVLAVAIAAYIAFGVGHIQPDFFDAGQFMTGGFSGFLLASVYLIFATGGATYVVNYSSQAENPTKDIPFAIVASTVGVVGIYAVMAAIASGVLPVSEVANKPLSVAALTFMPPSVYAFFVVGGAMFALLTTLNFSIGMMVYPCVRACQDGWLPMALAKTNNKFGTHHRFLFLFWLINILPLVLGIDVGIVANSTVIVTQVCKLLVLISALQLPKKMPELWAKSKFHVGDGALKVIGAVSILITVVAILLLLISSSAIQRYINLLFLVIAVVLTFLREKKVTLNLGYTEK